MITSFFLFFYILLSIIVMILLSIAFEGNMSTGYAWLFGIYVIPVSVLFGVAMITSSLVEKNYTTESIFELIILLIIFIILTPLSSYFILSIKNIHENEHYGITFFVCGFISFTPAILNIILVIQESTEKQFLTSKTAFFAAAILYLSTMIGMFFVPNE